MKKYEDYESTTALTGEFETIELGGHICKIISVGVTPAPSGKNYDELMTIRFDISEGKQKGFYDRKFKESMEKDVTKEPKWQGNIYQTIKSQDLRFFKGFMENIESSNTGFKWDWDETKLIGKLFGGVFGEEEYKANDGTIKISTKCVKVTTVENVKKGVAVPEIKRLAGYTQQAAAFTQSALDDNELPF